jgi:uncharacterized DUF497 family protein
VPSTFAPFDPLKSARNLAKHGIDFVQAQALWADDDRIEAPALSLTEARFIAIGRIGGKVWSCVYTYREAGIRIISCRPARRSERARYYRDHCG